MQGIDVCFSKVRAQEYLSRLRSGQPITVSSHDVMLLAGVCCYLQMMALLRCFEAATGGQQGSETEQDKAIIEGAAECIQIHTYAAVDFCVSLLTDVESGEYDESFEESVEAEVGPSAEPWRSYYRLRKGYKGRL